MLGAIIGDIAGSKIEDEEIKAIRSKEKKIDYESRIKILNSDIPLFTDDCSYTDDSILTSAIARAIIENKNYEYYLRKYANNELYHIHTSGLINSASQSLDKYGKEKFSKNFIEWTIGNFNGTSIGNGSAMRISPIAYYFDNYSDMVDEVSLSIISTHNSKEALDGALAISLSIYLAKNDFTKNQIKKYIESKYYDLNFNLEKLQKNYKFTSRCSLTVPQAIYCFLISETYEDSIRKAISIGGDTDTIACMTGSISEAFYGIDDNIIEEASNFIPEYIKNDINEFYEKLENKNSGLTLRKTYKRRY